MTTARMLALVLAGSNLVAAATYASEAIKYSYDARGRLIRVERSGSVNNNVSANYSYDKADNRTNVNTISRNQPPS